MSVLVDTTRKIVQLKPGQIDRYADYQASKPSCAQLLICKKSVIGQPMLEQKPSLMWEVIIVGRLQAQIS